MFFVLAKIVISMGLLWMIIVWVTKRRDFEWGDMLLAVAIATLIEQAGLSALFFGQNPTLFLPLGILGIIASYGFIFWIMKFRLAIEDTKQRWKILIVYAICKIAYIGMMTIII